MNALQFLEEGKSIELLENTGFKQKWGQTQEVTLNQRFSSPWVRHAYRKPAKTGAEVAQRIRRLKGSEGIWFD